ncbi:ANTAR domain-containing protein [Streptomyces sp. NPDC046859]|uniref:ANTAR domain-containing protein n=1 Tax=Streptomyces sp. NPDC046859 TaxID=3155734 RepID=UPI0033CF0DF9
MTNRSPLTMVPATDRATVVCLAGALDTDCCDRLAGELTRHLDRAARQGHRLVLDMTAVPAVAEAARRTLREETGCLAGAPVLVVATPEVRKELEQDDLPGMRLHGTLVEALTSLPPSTAPAPVRPARPRRTGKPPADAESMRGEIFGLRAKARTSGLIGVAQGMLIARYDLPGPAAAFALLREGSQQCNVPLRILASAVVTAPPPQTDAHWFLGRGTHAPPPDTAFVRAYGGDVTDRCHVLAAALDTAIAVAEADAGEVHLTDPAQDHALFLEGRRGLDAAYWDQVALVTGPPVVCAVARERLAPAAVPDVAADEALSAHPAGQALLAAGRRAVYSVPLITPETYCTGTLTLHRNEPGIWPRPARRTELARLAADVAAWRSWYRRTVVLDALEHLHQNRPKRGAAARSPDGGAGKR